MSADVRWNVVGKHQISMCACARTDPMFITHKLKGGGRDDVRGAEECLISAAWRKGRERKMELMNIGMRTI